MLDIAVIIISWNVRHYLADCVRSVNADLARSDLTGAIWVVDNGSTDGTPEFIRDLFPTVNLIVNAENRGFGAANNQGMRAAATFEPRYFLLLNPDTVVRPRAIDQLVRCLDNNPHVGMVGPRLVYRNDQFQHSAFEFPGLMQLLFEFVPLPGRLYETTLNGRYARSQYHTDSAPFPVGHPLGAAMLVRRDVAETTGGFDEAYHMYCEEIDWCWRIHAAGWGILTVPSAEIVHYGGESTRQAPAQSVVNLWRSRALFYRHRYGPLKLALARRVVHTGLAYKAWRASSAELKMAYRQAALVWRAGQSD